jgi:hypothetical protein
VRQCVTCGSRLPSDAKSYVTKCTTCFKLSKQLELNRLQETIEELEQELAATKYRLVVAQAQIGRHITLDGNLVKKMLVLCHPDRHDNSPVSNEVTRVLIQMRKQFA